MMHFAARLGAVVRDRELRLRILASRPSRGRRRAGTRPRSMMFGLGAGPPPSGSGCSPRSSSTASARIFDVQLLLGPLQALELGLVERPVVELADIADERRQECRLARLAPRPGSSCCRQARRDPPARAPRQSPRRTTYDVTPSCCPPSLKTPVRLRKRTFLCPPQETRDGTPKLGPM